MLKTAFTVILAVTFVLPAAAEAQSQRRPEQKRRDQIRVMEGVLAGAVRLGAEQIGREMQGANPNLLVLTGIPRAKGFVLDGYGVFFDVEIPGVMKSAMWSMRTLERDAHLAAALGALRKHVESLNDNLSRRQLDQALRRVELQVGPVPPEAGGTRGRVSAAQTLPTTGEDEAAAPDAYSDAGYTAAVVNAVIDAMLDYSGPMDLQAEEWLTVALRDSQGPLLQGEIYDASTYVLRVRGSDLALYRSDREQREAVRKRVDVREF